MIESSYLAGNTFDLIHFFFFLSKLSFSFASLLGGLFGINKLLVNVIILNQYYWLYIVRVSGKLLRPSSEFNFFMSQVCVRVLLKSKLLVESQLKVLQL